MFRLTSVFAAALIGVCIQSGAAEITLKVVTVFPSNHTLNQPFMEMIKDLNARGKGVLQVHYIGGPEAVPVPEQLSALQRGVTDIFFGPASFYDGQVPETGAHNASNKSAMELRQSNAFELLNRAFNAKANAQYLGYLGSGYTFHIYLKDEPRRTAAGGIDMQGLKIRGASIYRPFYDTQKITTVNVQVPEIYTALERGVIDGVGFTTIGLTQLGWDKQVKYRVFPPFWQGDMAIIANVDSWKKLDAKQKELLTGAVVETEKKAHAFFQAEGKREEEKLHAAGIKDIRPSAEEGRKYSAAAFNSLWEQLGKRLPKNDVDDLRKAFYKE